MGALLAAGGSGGAFHQLAGHFGSSRPKTTAFDNLKDRGKGMTKEERAAFLAREEAKEAKGNGLQANTPLSSRYA